MIARSIAPGSGLGRVFIVLAPLLVAGIGASCDRVPLTAPTQSTIQLFSTAPSVPLNGSIDLIATITEQAGTPVPDGTLVSFTTTLGRIEPSETRTDNGKATVKLVAGTQSGTATVTAFSGAATSGSGDNATAGARIEVAIGAAAVGSIVVRAEPATIAPGGTAQIIAVALDAGGNAMAGIPVAFTANAGQLQAGLVATNAQGEARTSLTTNVEATVTARAGVASGNTPAPSGEVTVTVAAAAQITLTFAPLNPTLGPTVGQPVTFTIGVTPGGSPVQSVRIEFGDGDSADLGAVSGTTSATHIYEEDDSYTVRVTVTDASNQTTSQAIVIVVLPAPVAP
jgi:hypothetical protein